MKPQKRILLTSILIGLITGMVVNYVFLIPPRAAETNIDYWRGSVDRQLSDNESRDKVLFGKLDSIEREIKSICDDLTAVKVEAARNGVLYGTASSVISYLIGLLIQMLSRRRNGVKA
jgi:ABC-type Fe3+ transport system permease subunit